MKESLIISKNQKNVSIGRSCKGYGFTYYALNEFKKGEVVMSGYGKVVDHQTSHISVQLEIDRHYLPTKWTGRYWNHSCDPNTFVRTRADGFPDLVALRDINMGEEINYAYWMTEYSWVANADETKVKCLCGTDNCVGKILAFSELPEAFRKKVRSEKLCAEYLCGCA